MSGSNAGNQDAMLRRLDAELRDKQTVVNGILERANAGERDLNDDEKSMLDENRDRMVQIQDQAKRIEDVYQVAYESRNRSRLVGEAIDQLRGKPQVGEVEYRSAGSWALDMYKSHLGDRDANERLEHLTTVPRRSSEDYRQPRCGAGSGRRRCHQLH